jgi:signal transduction histidine kinase
MGLGLFLAQTFAELCAGALEIDSVEHEGTRVSLTLPLSSGEGA